MTIQLTDKDIRNTINSMKPVYLYNDKENKIWFSICFCWDTNVEPKFTYCYNIGNYSASFSNTTLHEALDKFHQDLKEHDERTY